MSLSNEQSIFLKDLMIFLDYLINIEKLKITATWLGRNEIVQKYLYDKGLSKTMDSNHLKNCAIDLNIFYGTRILTNIKKKDLTEKETELLNRIAVFWENLNKKNRSGYFFKSIYDPGHFERNV